MKAERSNVHWVSLFVFALTGYALIFLEARFSAFRNLTGAQIDFLPGLMVYASLAFPFPITLFAAALLGVLYDSLSANPIGTTTVALALLAFVTRHYRDYLLFASSTTHWVLGIAVSGLAPILQLLLLWLGGQQPLVGFGSLWQWAIMTAGGGAATPLWFWLFNRLDEALSYKEAPESTFSPNRQIARGRH